MVFINVKKDDPTAHRDPKKTLEVPYCSARDQAKSGLNLDLFIK
jgi:hypothetical protein